LILNSSNKIVVIIPAYNEQGSIGKVIRDIPKELISETVVCNNGSTDNTASVAKNAGATVVFESESGYGNACLAGINYFKLQETKPDIVVFLDGDYSDYPHEMVNLTREIVEKEVDLVIGSRSTGQKEKGSMTPQQIFGNWLATNLMHLFYGVKFTDLGPFRAIKWDSLVALNMQDKTYGWTIEMQLKAIKLKMKTSEISVNYRKRIGVSKVSGTIKGTVLAGYKIITAIFKYL
jgi:glycosyltransferase involved in cell wall biosynthesis